MAENLYPNSQQPINGIRLQQTLTSSGSVTIPSNIQFVYAIVVGGGGGSGGVLGAGGGGGAGSTSGTAGLGGNGCILLYY